MFIYFICVYMHMYIWVFSPPPFLFFYANSYYLCIEETGLSEKIYFYLFVRIFMYGPCSMPKWHVKKKKKKGTMCTWFLQNHVTFADQQSGESVIMILKIKYWLIKLFLSCNFHVPQCKRCPVCNQKNWLRWVVLFFSKA